MTRQDYEKLGREVKAKEPCYEDMDDYELGRSYHNKFLAEDFPYEPLDVSVPVVLPGVRANHKKKQTEYVAASYELDEALSGNEHMRKHRVEARDQQLETSRIMHKQGMLVAQSLVQGAENALEANPVQHQIAMNHMIEAGKQG